MALELKKLTDGKAFHDLAKERQCSQNTGIYWTCDKEGPSPSDGDVIRAWGYNNWHSTSSCCRLVVGYELNAVITVVNSLTTQVEQLNRSSDEQQQAQVELLKQQQALTEDLRILRIDLAEERQRRQQTEDAAQMLVADIQLLQGQLAQTQGLLGIGKPFETSRYLQMYKELSQNHRRPQDLTKDIVFADLEAMLLAVSPYKDEMQHAKAVEITMSAVRKDVADKNANDVEKVIEVVWTTDVVLPSMLSIADVQPGMEITLDVPNHGRCTAKTLDAFIPGATGVSVRWISTNGASGYPSPNVVSVADWSTWNARQERGRPEICFILGHTIRSEDEGAMAGAVGLSLALREFTGKARSGFSVAWPAPNSQGHIQVTRGGGITTEALNFFQARLNSPTETGRWYRPAMPLATSRHMSSSDQFIQRTNQLHPERHLVRYIITIDPNEKCMHANFVTGGKFGSTEQEIIFAAYSPMKVEQVCVSNTPTNPATPHEIHLYAAPDGKGLPDFLPTAVFH